MTSNTTLGTERILAMPDFDFEELIISQLRREERNEQLWELLLTPAVLPRTHEMLDMMQSRTKSVMDNKSAELEQFRSSCEAMGPVGQKVWKDGRLERMRSFDGSRRFLRLVEDAQVQIRHRLKQAGLDTTDSNGRQPVRRVIPALQRLVEHMVNHQKEMSEDPSEADEELWAALDKVTVILHGKTKTLRQAHEANWANDLPPKGTSGG